MLTGESVTSGGVDMLTGEYCHIRWSRRVDRWVLTHQAE